MCVTSAAAESHAHHQIRSDVTCSRFLERSVCHFPEVTRQTVEPVRDPTWYTVGALCSSQRINVVRRRCIVSFMCIVISIWAFHFLFMRKPTPDWPLFAFKGSETFLSSSHFADPDYILYTNLDSLSSSSNSCMCSSLSLTL